ncbi:AbrB/MazE/SpoVT family DNA-binding domain-containing protein [Bacillus sp. 17RED48]|uniref:AbrB/MazE/SpoVT family DNA-binding domain-containing protein n=1 Tax=Bacillus TaxID=1386 RepID=UPI001C9AF599|nr:MULTISPECIES: AbrB/MazE/SpoVT family DNA-binding domain-containing protein [Bacillus]MBY7115372.1 AbrB/MazE/SpoVT family DNA-binding domain-containing protein [Bacillus sp. 17RED48]
MKATGIIRKIDELGRIVIPKELRRTLCIEEKNPMVIFVEDDQIILKKYQSQQACIITDEISDRNVSLVNGKIVLSPEGANLLIKELQQYLVK